MNEVTTTDVLNAIRPGQWVRNIDDTLAGVQLKEGVPPITQQEFESNIRLTYEQFMLTMYTPQSNMTTYLDYLRNMNIVKYNEKNAGAKPVKNPCQHVAMLVSIRKISDDSDRFQELAKFFRKMHPGNLI